VSVDRDPNIVLPVTAARCSPATYCPQAFDCARARAPIQSPPHHAQMISAGYPPLPGACPMFLKAAEYHRKRAQPTAEPATPKIWPGLGWSDSEGGEL
jgi:hypothetical protein